MRRYNLNEEIENIDYWLEIVDKYKIKSEIYIEKARAVFESKKIKVSETNNNSFDFKFLGLDFIAKANISFNKESSKFNDGELNIFHKKNDDFELIISYSFDKIGNIENTFNTDTFALYFYVDFIKMVLNSSTEKGIKFQLL
ncbi:hypothetical protein Palpr_2233 [Paludibacter propionicigenes WB4]|uniref:Uncharacterized protein n=1 Tax=Paludibacter propionicigenes (strain DSM 17365 / JCM 13257 / WB4) TaxID=694427 RepID=E4T6M5_PALPW|nr:hypothetical protein [Paludibacter propionicigenes]ADQ80369.1 hypothetical protein Palpr_2233 [Paludibacter propionicigenes WB4]